MKSLRDYQYAGIGNNCLICGKMIGMKDYNHFEIEFSVVKASKSKKCGYQPQRTLYWHRSCRLAENKETCLNSSVG